MSATGLLSRAADALDRVHSFRLDATWFYFDFVPRRLTAEFSLPGRAALSIQSGGLNAKLVVIGDTAYVRANVRYWASSVSTPNVVDVLSSHWVKLPASEVPNLAAYEALAQPQSVGRCLLGSKASSASGPSRADVNGQNVSAFNLFVDGDRGIPALDILLSASGPPLPLSISQLGPTGPNAADPVCGRLQTQPNPVRNSMIVLSHYNGPVRIVPPTGWVNGSTLVKAIARAAPRPSSMDVSNEVVQERELLGTWTATGQIIESHNFANETRGLTFQRLWQITRSCAAGPCRPFITRTTGAGPLSTWLVWARDHWTADFVTTAPCQDGTSSTEYEDWTIRVRPGSITAAEYDHTSGSCPTSTDAVQWSAHPAPGSGSSRSS